VPWGCQGMASVAGFEHHRAASLRNRLGAPGGLVTPLVPARIPTLVSGDHSGVVSR